MFKLHPDWMNFAAVTGRQQAFAVIASKCSAAQALCLREVRESRFYEKLELNWDEYCKQYAGIGRSRADEIIQQLDEFGETYFRLSTIARVSPEAYRELAPAIHDDVIELEGEIIPINRENAARLRQVVAALRRRVALEQRRNAAAGGIVGRLQDRADRFVRDIAVLYRDDAKAGDRPALLQAARHAAEKINRLVLDLESTATPSELPERPS